MVRTALFWLVCSLIVLTLGPVFIIVGCFDKSKKITDKIACFWVKSLILISGIKIEIEDKEILKVGDIKVEVKKSGNIALATASYKGKIEQAVLILPSVHENELISVLLKKEKSKKSNTKSR